MQSSEISHRNTKQKKLIIDTLCALGSHVSAGAIYNELHTGNPQVGRSTVYRVLANMASDGDLLRIHVPGEEDRYDITSAPHAHIVCRKCGKVRDIQLSETLDISRCVISSAGYSVDSDTIILTGLCADCLSPKS